MPLPTHEVTISCYGVEVGRSVHHLRTEHADGGRTDDYFDTSSLMHVMSLSRVPMHGEGRILEILSVNSDFRRVGGVLLAHRNVQQKLSNAEVLSTMIWDRIEANVEIADAWFSPPPSPEAERYADFRAVALDGRLDDLPPL